LAKKIFVIDTCSECSHIHSTDFNDQCENPEIYKKYGIFPKTIRDVADIPKWCPLEDYKGDDRIG
jgi:hypothetical protein